MGMEKKKKSYVAFPENPESIQYFQTTQVNIRKQQAVLLHICAYTSSGCVTTSNPGWWKLESIKN